MVTYFINVEIFRIMKQKIIFAVKFLNLDLYLAHVISEQATTRKFGSNLGT